MARAKISIKIRLLKFLKAVMSNTKLWKTVDVLVFGLIIFGFIGFYYDYNFTVYLMSICVYFIYKEVIKDILSMIRLRGKS